MNRMLAVALAAFATLALTPAGTAAAQPSTAPAPAPDTQTRMRLDVESLTPRVITADTPAITVTGQVTNTGDRHIDDVRVQLVRGEPLDTEEKLRDVQREVPDSARTSFVPVTASLEPGQSAPVALSVAVSGGQGSLRIDTPGTYQLLININGRPEYSRQARLAAVSVLLPALSTPGGRGTPPVADPARLTVLWPLIDDYPRQVQAPGGRPVLTDDGLATSLAPGGRLYGLVRALQDEAGADPALLDAICFAVDPDLLETVQQMALGYQVRLANGQLENGAGTEAAKVWLAALRALTAGQCVLAVPYADADLVALSRAGALDLEELALSSASVVADVLKPVQPVPGVLWPAAGALDQRTMLDLAGTATTTVLTDPAHLHDRQGEQPYALSGPPAKGPVRSLPIDSLVSSFLDDTSGYWTAANGLTGHDEPVSVQNGIAALAFELTAGEQRGSGRSTLIAPPRRWAAPAEELTVFLQTVRHAFDAELAEPLGLVAAASAGPRGTASGFNYGAEDAGLEISAAVTGEAVRINTARRNLVDAMRLDDTVRVDPHVLVEPLRYGLLRATSTAWRGHADLADRAVDEVAAQLDALLGQVTVANSGRPLTLASGDSPIPVVISNALPVTVVVRIKLADTPGLRPEAIPDVVIPARSSINRPLPAEVIRSGRFTVDVSLSTPNGTPLGSTARLELTSTTYGKITLIVTATAAAAMFLLVGLRIFRRIRTARRTDPEARQQ